MDAPAALAVIWTELHAFRTALREEPLDESFPDPVRRVLVTIHNHLFEPQLNVAFVLDQCGIRNKAFPTEFKFYLQRTIHRYIEDNLMMAAMSLLPREELDITLIGMSLGYKSYRSFARAFKRYVGTTASDYRETLMKAFAESTVEASEGPSGGDTGAEGPPAERQAFLSSGEGRPPAPAYGAGLWRDSSATAASGEAYLPVSSFAPGAGVSFL